MPDSAQRTPVPFRRPAAPDESELVLRASRGDVRAFELLYQAHVNRVYALTLRMTGNAGRAEELTQDVFVRAWSRLSSFRGESAFSTWLHRLAANVVLADLRKGKRRDDLWSPDDGRPPAAVAPDTRLDLEAAIRTLPPGARQVFVLHDIEGYRHDEIAELAGIAVGTSRAHLHWARRLLKEVITS